MDRENQRKLVHISMVLFALAVGRLPNWAIVACCLAALVMNKFLLPRMTRRALEREEDRARGFSIGLLMYPGILLLISILFYQMQVFLVIAWSAMAFGDGFAGLLGRNLGGPKLFWRPQKSWTGLLAFWILGFGFSYLWLLLIPEQMLLGISVEQWAWIVAAGILVAGLLETIDGFIDDNFIVPLSAAVVSFVAYLVIAEGVVPPPIPVKWQYGLSLVVLFTVITIVSRKITLAGGLVGGVLAWLIFAGGGEVNLALLLVFFVAGTAASKWHFSRKVQLGLAQENRGIRGVNNAVSNAGIAAFLGLAAWCLPQHATMFAVMIAGSLAAALSDTLSSEFGNLYGKRYLNVLSFKADERGRDGAISLEGSIVGLLGALLIGSIYAFYSGQIAGLWIVTAAGLFGNYMDSVLGATLQRRFLMTNDTVNFANTALASLAAMLLYLLM